MARIDEDQRFREERAVQLRDRDREREPRRFRPARRDLAGRDSLKIALADRGASVDVRDEHEAPQCQDSDRRGANHEAR